MTLKIDQIIKNINGTAYSKFLDARERLFSEEDLRVAFSSLFNQILQENDISINQERHELAVYKGRIDSLYGEIIIEYKAPKLLADDNESSKNKSAIEQVETHIKGLEEKNKSTNARYLGVIFDGYKIIFVRRRNNIWDVENPTDVNLQTFTLLLKRLLSLGLSGKALIIDNLIKDFGTDSQNIVDSIRKLYLILDKTQNPKVKLLYEQWSTYFRQICGYEFETKKIEIKELVQLYGIPDEDASLPKIIFSIHTLYSLFIKLLAAETLTYFRHREGSYVSKIDCSNNQQLKIDMQSLEKGQLFQYEGIQNFLEGDFFSWYLDNWNDEIADILGVLIQKFKGYDFSSLNLEPKEAKDLIKGIYHYLLPKKIRHSLGEYYTPDWLAEHLINSMDMDLSKDIKVLDPTCGSGTFLTLMAERIRNYEEKKGATNTEVFNRIIKSIVGIDLNPLAVIAAKTNFIISIADLLENIQVEFEIPIYQSDSMLVTLEFHEEGKDYLSIPTKVGNFDLPVSVVTNGSFGKVLEILIEQVGVEGSPDNLKEKIQSLNIQFDDSEITTLKKLYTRILELEKQNLDGIWLKIIKNFFTPAFLEKFDYIIGNPPWINWQTLPEDYRDSIKKYWTDYKIFLHKGLAARLGSAHDDLCVLLTYVVIDNFLKDKGKLGFVLPQNLLQSSGGGEGFRRFMVKDATPVKVLQVDDFVKVNPFSDIGASNKTAVMIMQKDEKIDYPVRYYKWNKNNSGKVPSDIRLSAAKQLLSISDGFAEPILNNTPSSPWLIANSEAILEKLKHLVGKSPYRARKGVDTSLNGLYWGKIAPSRVKGVSEFSNDSSLSRKAVKKYRALIEDELIYPILRGSDISKWQANPEYSSIIPYHKDGSWIDEDELKTKYPNAYKYFFKTDEQIALSLKTRAIYQKHLAGINAPIYALYDIGSYTFSPYKVVWKALASGMIACVISLKDSTSEIVNNMIIPDHNVLMVPIDDRDEAYYLSGVINSAIVNEFVTSYISWFYSSHILERLRIPKFDKNNSNHLKISQLSIKAHMSTSQSETEAIEDEINKKTLMIF